MSVETDGYNDRPPEKDLEQLLSAAEMLAYWTRGRAKVEAEKSDAKQEQLPEK